MKISPFGKEIDHCFVLPGMILHCTACDCFVIHQQTRSKTVYTPTPDTNLEEEALLLGEDSIFPSGDLVKSRDQDVELDQSALQFSDQFLHLNAGKHTQLCTVKANSNTA